MQTMSFLPILISILLSSGAQVLLKMGMAKQSVQAALSSHRSFVDVAFLVARTPAVLLGLLAFGLSLLVWLSVLSRTDVSRAYPCVALGIVVTVIAGHVLFGERVPIMQVAGLLAISGGVMLVAFGR